MSSTRAGGGGLGINNIDRRLLKCREAGLTCTVTDKSLLRFGLPQGTGTCELLISRLYTGLLSKKQDVPTGALYP